MKLKACWFSLFLLVIATSFPMVNYQDAFADPIEILFQDDFNDNSIDTGKWTESDPDGVIDELNNRLEYNRIGVGDEDATIFGTFNDGIDIVTAQAFLSQTPVDTTHRLSFKLSGSSGEVFIRIGTIGDNTFELVGINSQQTAITGGKDVKIEYDTVTSDLNFYYWSGSAWVQMGVTDNRTVLSPFRIIFEDQATTVIAQAIADNVFLTQGTYTTHFPEIAIPPSPPRTGGGGTTYADILESRAKQAIQDEISSAQVTEQSPLESLAQTLNTDLQLQSFLPNQNLGITLPFAPTILNLVILIGTITAISFIVLRTMRKI